MRCYLSGIGSRCAKSTKTMLGRLVIRCGRSRCAMTDVSRSDVSPSIAAPTGERTNMWDIEWDPEPMVGEDVQNPAEGYYKPVDTVDTSMYNDVHDEHQSTTQRGAAESDRRGQGRRA